MKQSTLPLYIHIGYIKKVVSTIHVCSDHRMNRERHLNINTMSTYYSRMSNNIESDYLNKHIVFIVTKCKRKEAEVIKINVVIILLKCDKGVRWDKWDENKDDNNNNNIKSFNDIVELKIFICINCQREFSDNSRTLLINYLRNNFNDTNWHIIKKIMRESSKSENLIKI